MACMRTSCIDCTTGCMRSATASTLEGFTVIIPQPYSTMMLFLILHRHPIASLPPMTCVKAAVLPEAHLAMHGLKDLRKTRYTEESLK